MLPVEECARFGVDALSTVARPVRARSRKKMVLLSVGDTKVVTRVQIVTDKTQFGTRRWFACPSCAHRRRFLHLVDGRVGCRGCLGLLYREQCWPDSRWRRDVLRPVLRMWRRTVRQGKARFQ
jgi:hypothetical protein